MLHRFVRLLLSRGMAIALMSAMALVLALSTLVPPPDAAPERLAELRRTRPAAAFVVERLRPEQVARSPAFVAMALLAFASTAWSIVGRVRIERDRRRLRAEPALERFRAARSVEPFVAAESAVQAVRAFAQRKGYTLHEARTVGPETVLLATRGMIGFWGSISFHVGILVTMVAVAVSARTRFNAEALLVDGVARPLVPGVVFNATRPAPAAELASWVAGIRDFHAQYARGFEHVDFAAIFESVGPGGERRDEVVRVNQPVERGGFLFTLSRYGFAPALRVDLGGRTLADGLALLRVIPPGTEDGLALADGSELRLALYPDYATRDGRPVSRGMALASPVLIVRHLDRGRELAAGQVRRGESATIGALSVSFPEVRYWAHFQIARDAGLLWFAVGSALVAVGLGIRFTFDPQTLRFTIVGSRGGARVELVTSARYFPALNDLRAERLGAELAATLASQNEGNG